MTIQFKAKKLAQSISELIKKKSKNFSEFKTVHSPIDFGVNASNYLSRCLTSTWVSSGGGFVEEFSKKISSFTGASYAVAVSSGTSALRMALLSLQVNLSLIHI